MPSLNCLVKSTLLLSVAMVVHASAITYVVGPGRTYTTLSNVTSRLNPGDSVEVDGNTTYAGGVQFTRPGTSDRKIFIRGIRSNGNRPIITGGTNTVHFNGSHHLVFEGFEITGGTFRGIFHQADSVTVRDVVVHDCPAHGILGADIGSGSLTLEYCEVYRCGAGSSQHQIYMATDEVNFPGSVFRMQFCYLHDALGGNNVKSRSERNEIYYNWIEGAYYHELELIGPDPGGAPAGWSIRHKREDSDVVGNVLMKRRTAAGNDSNFAVTRLGGDGTGWSHGRYRFVNNTIVAGSGAVFRLFDTLESVEMHNNVFYRASGGATIMRANAAEMGWASGAPVIAGSNNWVVNGSTTIPAQWNTTKTGTNPGFADGAMQDFRPAAGSALVDSGTNTPAGPAGFTFPNPLERPLFVPPMRALPMPGTAQSRPVNGIIDIGAFEYAALSVAAIQTVARVRAQMRCFPDPFVSCVNIVITAPRNASPVLEVFGLNGARISAMPMRHADNRWTCVWNGNNANGQPQPSGLFLFRATTGNHVVHAKAMKK